LLLSVILEETLTLRSSQIHAARRGDPTAIDTVIESLRPRIERMAAHYGRCRAVDSDDLLQEAWIGLLEALPSLDMTIGVPEQHLILRAKWRMLDAVRRANQRRCLSLDMDGAPEFDARDEHGAGPGATRRRSPDDTLSSISLNQFVDQLDCVQRRIVSCLLDGLTWRETASELGCTSPNIAYHVRRVRERYLDWVE
jgi:RNA polymerase sigma-70 factor (ECF subfamily)